VSGGYPVKHVKDKWHADPAHHGSLEIPPPPPKKSCLDKTRKDGSPDQDGTLALSRISEEDPEKNRRYMLVLQPSQDDPVTRPFALPERAPGGRKGGNMEGEETRGCSGFVSQSQLGKAVCKVPGTYGRGRTVADGTGEGGARAARMDNWVVWETREEGARGVG